MKHAYYETISTQNFLKNENHPIPTLYGQSKNLGRGVQDTFYV